MIRIAQIKRLLRIVSTTRLVTNFVGEPLYFLITVYLGGLYVPVTLTGDP